MEMYNAGFVRLNYTMSAKKYDKFRSYPWHWGFEMCLNATYKENHVEGTISSYLVHNVMYPSCLIFLNPTC